MEAGERGKDVVCNMFYVLSICKKAFSLIIITYYILHSTFIGVKCAKYYRFIINFRLTDIFPVWILTRYMPEDNPETLTLAVCMPFSIIISLSKIPVIE
jgi:hypothetical protein